jgi:outer membrane beta-barrel protein
MKIKLAIVWLLVHPVLALAQEAPGLDLSQPPKEQKQPADQGDELPPMDLSKAQGDKPTAGKAADKQGAESGKDARSLVPFSEKDVALGDKVKAVQRKGFLKRGRFEVTPMFALSVNDAYYQKFGGALRLAYNLQDSFALALRGAYYGDPYRTDNVREGKVAFSSQLLSSQPYGQAMLDGVWSPVYGKAAFLGSTIVHFDLFLTGGFGLVWSATSFAPRSEGPHLATDLGGGIRFYPKEWLAFEMSLIATLYPDQPILSVPGTIQSVITANVGFSFFFPFHFEYVYP